MFSVTQIPHLGYHFDDRNRTITHAKEETVRQVEVVLMGKVNIARGGSGGEGLS